MSELPFYSNMDFFLNTKEVKLLCLLLRLVNYALGRLSLNDASLEINRAANWMRIELPRMWACI